MLAEAQRPSSGSTTEGELLATIPRTTTKDVTRYKAYGWTGNIR